MGHKYNARATVIDGIEFSSRAEGKHYAELKLRERAKEIRDLTLQPEFALWEGGRDRNGKKHRAMVYRADFAYVNCKTGETHVVDVKGMRLPMYLLKRKMFLVKYPEYVFEEV